MRSDRAMDIIKRDPREFFLRSIRGMLPKNRLYEQFLKNIIYFNGSEHNLHNIGLPQFNTPVPINFDKMFGSEIDKDMLTIQPNPQDDPELIQKAIEEGYKIKEDKESHLRDFMKTRSYNNYNERAMKNFTKKQDARRRKLWRKVVMMNYTYL
jgi:hypothetical protein